MKEKNAIFLATEKKMKKTRNEKENVSIWKKKSPPAYYHHVPTLILASKGYLLRVGFDIRVSRVLPMADAQMSGWQIPLANLRPLPKLKPEKLLSTLFIQKAMQDILKNTKKTGEDCYRIVCLIAL